MKVKNIMFSGFMAAILMGATGAADAAINVASKDYVDAKSGSVTTALNEYKTENDAKVNKNAADIATNANSIQSVANTLTTVSETLDGKAGKSYVDTELAKKQNNLTVTGGVLTWDAETSTLGLTGIATSDNLETLQNTVNTLSADANTDGSVKKQIADAIAGEVTRSDSYADQAEADAIAAAEAKVTELANGAVKDNTDAIAAINNADTGILKQAQEYADANDADTIYDDTQVKADIAANTQAIAAMDTNYVSEDEMNTFKTSNTAEIAAAKKAGDDAQADLDEYKSSNDTAVAAAKNQADKGVADAATAQSAAAAAQTAADAAQTAANKAQADATQALTNAAAAQSAADAAQATANDNKTKISSLESELANKITAPEACETQDCVLSINKASGTISWVPLTEPVADYM